jgi:hypothetical protein
MQTTESPTRVVLAIRPTQAAEKLPSATVSYQGTTSVVPKGPLLLMFRADFSPRGGDQSDFISSLIGS